MCECLSNITYLLQIFNLKIIKIREFLHLVKTLIVLLTFEHQYEHILCQMEIKYCQVYKEHHQHIN